MISFEICMVQLSVGFSRGSTVYCQGSRIVFLSFFLSFGRKISRFFGLVKNIPCDSISIFVSVPHVAHTKPLNRTQDLTESRGRLASHAGDLGDLVFHPSWGGGGGGGGGGEMKDELP